MDLRERVGELTRKGFYDIDTNRLVEIYGAVFSQPVCPTCTKELINAYNSLKKWHREGAESKQVMGKQKKYRFKKEFENSVVPLLGGKVQVSALNLDQYAKELMAMPARAAMIEEVPEEEVQKNRKSAEKQ